ncbi:MAG: YceI family protein [Bacteroidia bacterium]
MNSLNHISKKILLVAIAISSVIFLERCTKEITPKVTVNGQRNDVYTDKVLSIINPQVEVPVPVNFTMDATYTHDKTHSNDNWKSRYYDFSDTWLTGRFGDFGFSPKFEFDGTDLTKCKMNMWVRVSTASTSEAGRDGYGKCGPNYFGVVYTDSNKTAVDPLCDTAWFRGTSFTKQGNGYLVKGTMTFNRYLPASGNADGTPITKPVEVYLSYNGSYDFDTNNDGTPDKMRVGFSAKFKFNRSDYMDKTATKMYFPFPKASEKANSDLGFASNKTYGVWSGSVADEMIVECNHVFFKNH